jgi:serine phosphatase RsbU (regulator of sigma subunit)
VLTGVDELLVGSNLDFLATCFYAKLTLHAGGATLRYSSAGHPPAIVRAPDGSTTLLDGGRGAMIGVSALTPSDSGRPADALIELAQGSTLICFTDGLVDAFAAEPDIDVGLAELRRLAAALPSDATPQAIVDQLTHTELRHKDDVAVVAIRIV